ncbi:MAG: type II toxin-antitoxin system VapC family toxin [Acidobacteriota bacterium]|nr:type II toxin-antitoxin system VapC family toxin [Acidobacteriota bacterium]
MSIVVDANILVAQVLELDYSEAARAKLAEWLDQDLRLYAPTLWRYEALSALRKFVRHKILLQKEAVEAIKAFAGLGIQEVRPSPALEEETLVWADRLDQAVAYDAAYVALAESLEFELWTADRRLARAARAAGAAWVRSLQEAEAS